MIPIYLIVGLINIFAQYNNYNINYDNDTAILRARRSLQDAVLYEAADVLNNLKSNEEIRTKREIKHYFYKNHTNEASFGSQNGYNTNSNRLVTSLYPNNENRYNITVTNSYWNNPDQNNNTISYGYYNGNGNSQYLNNWYYDSKGNNYTGYPGYANTYNNDFTNGFNSSGPVNTNTPIYNSTMYPGYNLPRFNYSSPSYHNYYKPGYNGNISNDSNGYQRFNGYLDNTVNSTAVNNDISDKVSSTTARIVSGCVICNIGCPAFMKKIGNFCMSDNNDYDYS